MKLMTFQPNRSPTIDPTAFVAANATVVGDVHIAAEVSILFGAVLRGDTTQISLGQGSNVQDQCCLHGDPGFPCQLGCNVTVGHRAVVHGAVIADNVLIGIGAIVLNGASVGEWSIIAAGCVVAEGKVIPPGSLVMGVPGKVVRQTNAQDRAMILHAAEHYVELGRFYNQQSQL